MLDITQRKRNAYRKYDVSLVYGSDGKMDRRKYVAFARALSGVPTGKSVPLDIPEDIDGDALEMYLKKKRFNLTRAVDRAFVEAFGRIFCTKLPDVWSCVRVDVATSTSDGHTHVLRFSESCHVIACSGRLTMDLLKEQGAAGVDLFDVAGATHYFYGKGVADVYRQRFGRAYDKTVLQHLWEFVRHTPPLAEAIYLRHPVKYFSRAV